MQVKLGAVLAGVGAGAREAEDEGLVEGSASVAEGAEGGEARFKIGCAEGSEGSVCCGTRQAKNGDGPPAGRCGEGEDSVVHGKCLRPISWGGGGELFASRRRGS